MNHKQLYAERIASFLKNYIQTKCSEIKTEVNNLNSITSTYNTLQKLYLLNFIIKKLYQAEYPEVYKKLLSEHTEIRLFSTWFKKIEDHILTNQLDGPFILGGNHIIKHKKNFYLLTHTQKTFHIKFSEIAGYPAETEKIAIMPELKQYNKKQYTHIIKFEQESKIQNLFDSKIQELHKKQTSNDKSIFEKKLKHLFSINKIKDYKSEFSFIYKESLSEIIGYKESQKLCKQRATILQRTDPNNSYYNQFMQNFDNQYQKRVLFYSTVAEFAKNTIKNQHNVWFLRDQIEPFLMKKCMDSIANRQKQDSFIMISRDSTSINKKDHYLYSYINEWYFESAQKHSNYEDFINHFTDLLKSEINSNPKIRQITNQIWKHLTNQKLTQKEETELTFIDTGFQGSFNMIVEALYKINLPDTKIDHYLLGIWPWLSKLLNNKYLTDYFPFVLIVEYFDGIHELATFKKQTNGIVKFENADPKHQLATFLDLIIIRDIAILESLKQRS